MILGIGTDLVEIERLERAYSRHGSRLLARVLSDRERSAMPPVHTARFAAWLAVGALPRKTSKHWVPDFAMASRCTILKHNTPY